MKRERYTNDACAPEDAMLRPLKKSRNGMLPPITPMKTSWTHCFRVRERSSFAWPNARKTEARRTATSEFFKVAYRKGSKPDTAKPFMKTDAPETNAVARANKRPFSSLIKRNWGNKLKKVRSPIEFVAEKLKVGWITFTCSEDSAIMFTELLNDHYFEWKDVLDIKFARFMKTKNILEDIDVMFVEGAISTKKEEDKAREVREKSRKVVAVGACAVTGMPSAQRNNFDERTKREIQFVLERFGHNEKVVPVKAVIQVDDEIPGCPMDCNKFVAIVDKYLDEFGVRKKQG